MAAKVPFRGGFTCTCVARSLPLVEQVMLSRGLIGESIDGLQYGWRGDVGASAGTHAMGGNTDVGQYSDAHIAVWRWAGWTIQHRTRAQGFDPHGHGWPWGCSHLSPAGQSQATQWRNGTNGLVSRGPILGPYPVVEWTTGIKRMEADLTKFADDIVDRTSRRTAALTAKTVWEADTIPNKGVYAADPANENVRAEYALYALGARTKRLEEKVDLLLAQIGKLGT